METISHHLEELKAFHAVATAGGFSRAAERGGVSKAQLSKQIQRLETALRARLFHRSTRRVQLTEEGTALLAYSRQILALSDEASLRLQALSQGDAGPVRISTTVSFGEVFFPSFVADARARLPRAQFECDLSNEARDFAREKLDFAIRAVDLSEDGQAPDLVARYLGKLRDVICVAPALVKRAPTRPEDLAQAECILTSVDEGWNDWTLTSRAGEIRVRAQGAVSTNQYTLARNLVLAGKGVARMPVYMVREDLAARRLVQLFPAYQIATHPLYLVSRPGRYASRRHQLARETILAWFKARPEIFTKA